MSKVYLVACAGHGIIGKATEKEVDDFLREHANPLGDEDKEELANELFFSPMMMMRLEVCGAPVSVNVKEEASV